MWPLAKLQYLGTTLRNHLQYVHYYPPSGAKQIDLWVDGMCHSFIIPTYLHTWNLCGSLDLSLPEKCPPWNRYASHKVIEDATANISLSDSVRPWSLTTHHKHSTTHFRHLTSDHVPPFRNSTPYYRLHSISLAFGLLSFMYIVCLLVPYLVSCSAVLLAPISYISVYIVLYQSLAVIIISSPFSPPVHPSLTDSLEVSDSFMAPSTNLSLSNKGIFHCCYT